MKLTDHEAMSFDCYGTLIDWESGIVRALSPWLERNGRSLDAEVLLTHFSELEPKTQEAHPRLDYPRLLGRVHEQLARRLEIPADPEEARRFGASVGDWPAFPDSSDALRHLSRHFKLAILSNVDDDSFALSEKRLGVKFDLVVTAQQAGSYKPDPNNFAALRRRLGEAGIDPDRTLHVAQSLYHDHEPAQAAGFRTIWIDRRQGKEGTGATAAPSGPVQPDLTFPTMEALVEAHRKELREIDFPRPGRAGAADPRVLAELERLGVRHDVILIEPAHGDTATFCEVYGFSEEDSANAIMVASKKEPRRFCVCMVLATTRLDVNRSVRKLMGVSKASFASAEDMQSRTGMEVGGLTPFALPEDIPLYIDSRVTQRERVIIGAGTRGAKILLSPSELLRIPGASVVDGLANE